MSYVLRSKGFAVSVAHDDNEGLMMAQRVNPALVILDLMMPKRSGFVVLDTLRRNRPVLLKIIMCTANEANRLKMQAEMLGVDDFIRKPFPIQRLLDRVDRLLCD